MAKIIEKYDLKLTNAILIVIHLVLIIAGIFEGIRMFLREGIALADQLTVIFTLVLYIAFLVFAIAGWKTEGGIKYKILLYASTVQIFLVYIAFHLYEIYSGNCADISMIITDIVIAYFTNMLLIIIAENLKNKKKCMICFGIIFIMQMGLFIYLVNSPMCEQWSKLTIASPWIFTTSLALCYATHLDRSYRAEKRSGN